MTKAAVKCSLTQSEQGANCSNTKGLWRMDIGLKVRDHSRETGTVQTCVYRPFIQMGAAVVTVWSKILKFLQLGINSQNKELNTLYVVASLQRISGILLLIFQ